MIFVSVLAMDEFDTQPCLSAVAFQMCQVSGRLVYKNPLCKTYISELMLSTANSDRPKFQIW